ncbi:MAG: LpxI family protein, partial [Alphaproteobacteria bacterium]|nr:LpxI family protein [Alphaproteobacteria bacterium]
MELATCPRFLKHLFRRNVSDYTLKLGIIAGGGAAPRQLIAACQKIGRPFFLACLEGQADPDLGKGVPHAWLPLGAGQKLKTLFTDAGVSEVVMIGRVRRPSLLEIRPDWLALKVLTKIGINSLGDDGLLRAIGKAIEEEGKVRLVGIQDVFADLLTPLGELTGTSPDEQARADIKRGIEVALALGRLDVGQAVVVQQGLVLGVEAIEGTDALIARSAAVRREGQGGVLVKLAKPQQDNRFDLPTIGPDTVAAAAKAGLRGIALQAGRSLIVDRE